MSNFRNLSFFILILMGLTASARAELTASLKIGDQVLQLNGAGVRTKTFVQIYESGLYPSKTFQGCSSNP